MKHLYLSLSIALLSLQLSAQQLLDNFNRANNNSVGNGWIETESQNTLASVNNGMLRLTSQTGTSGRVSVGRDVSGTYNSTPGLNGQSMTWSFNFRQSSTNPNGFNDGMFGAAFILGSTSANTTSGQGYAVIIGVPGSTDPVSLVSFSNGLRNTTLTRLIDCSANLPTAYLSVRVTYNPSNNSWTLSTRNDGASFADAGSNNNFASCGSVTNSAYIGIDLKYIHCLYNFGNQSQNALFDNIYVPGITQAPSCATLISPANAASVNCQLSATLQWQAPSSGAPVQGYKVYAGTDGNGNALPTNFINGTSVSNTNFNLTGLTANTTYYWTVLSVNSAGEAMGCSIFSFTTGDIPSAPVAPHMSRCGAGTVTLNASGAVSYNWYAAASGGTAIASGSSFTTPELNATTSYYVTAVSSDGCESQGRTQVTAVIHSLPEVQISADQTMPVCAGVTVSLISNYNSGNSWSTGATASSIQVTQAGIYAVEVTDNNNCHATATFEVTTDSCSFVWTGVVSSDWHEAGNWDKGLVPFSYSDVTIPSIVPNKPEVAKIAVARKLHLMTDAELTIATDGEINLKGDLTVNGIYIDNGITQFSGSVWQNISGIVEFNNLVLNNNIGIRINNQAKVKGKLFLSKGVLSTNDSLTVNLNTGSIVYYETDLGSVNGKIKVVKNVNSFRTHYISCPVEGTTAMDINDNTQVINPSNGRSRLFTLNFDTQSWVGITNLNTMLSPNTGYSIYYLNPGIIDYTGQYFHGKTYPGQTVSNAASDKMVFVTNPYPSSLDWDNEEGWTKSGIGNAIYYWDAAAGKYVSYVKGTATNEGSRFIPSLQSFFVMTDGTGGSAVVSANNNSRVNNPNINLFRKSNDEKLLRIVLKAEGQTDETVIRFSSEATFNFDYELDAVKIINPEGIPSIYTNVDGKKYSINSVAENKLKPIGIEADVLSSDTKEFVFYTTNVGEDLYLLDNSNNTSIQISDATSYSFSGDVNKGRFYITSRKDLDHKISDSWYITSDEANVTIYLSTSDKINVSVFDIMGKEVSRFENIIGNDGFFNLNVPEIISGVYVIRVDDNKNVISGKVFLRNKK
ncbi:MAG: fibronectin type III domain-containing protein [Cytophagaceae bacterium]